MGQVAIGHDRGDRAKGLNLMECCGRIGIRAMQQDRRHKCAIFCISAADQTLLRIAVDRVAFTRQKLQFVTHVLALRQRDQGTHLRIALRRVANFRRGQPL